ADQSAHTIVANVTSSPAPPTAHSLSTLAGDYLNYSSGVMSWAGFDSDENSSGGGGIGIGWKGLDFIDSTYISWSNSSPGGGFLGVSPALDLATLLAAIDSGTISVSGTTLVVNTSA